jgi:hypothetical protein
MNERRKFPPWVAALALLSLGAAYTGGRVYGQCTKTCATYNIGYCVYSGTGQILQPQSSCLLLRWASAGSGSYCYGSVTTNAKFCVGDGSYCQYPASGEYSNLTGCGSCSTNTTMSCCSSCT